MKLVYVMDYRDADGYLCRVPEFMAKLIIRRLKTQGVRFLDYAPTPAGL